VGVALGHHCCAWASLVAESGAYSLVAACGLLIAVASLVGEHRLSVLCGDLNGRESHKRGDICIRMTDSL